jgi:hypothetical protein
MEVYSILSDEGKTKKYAYAIWVENVPYRTISCDICKNKFQVNSLFDPEVIPKIVLKNNHYADFLWDYVMLTSEKVVEIFRKSDVTGCLLRNIDILPSSKLTKEQIKTLRADSVNVGKLSDEEVKYFRMFTDSTAEFHESCGMYLKEFCPLCGYRKYESKGKEYPSIDKIVIKKETIPNKDLFGAGGTGLYCSDRFKLIYEEKTLNGLIFSQVETV